jgi:uncharacterized protein (TIGR00255 family)
MSVSSMTGFGAAEGTVRTDGRALSWRWEARSVNARGLDLRPRLPEGWEGMEPELRRRAATLKRGAVTVGLKVTEAAAAGGAALDRAALAAAVAAAAEARAALASAGLPVTPISPEALLSLRGVLDVGRAAGPSAPDAAAEAAVLAGLDKALERLAAARAAEGVAIGAAMGAALDCIAAKVAEAAAAHAAQTAAAPSMLAERVAAILEAAGRGAPSPDRLAQELASLAVKQDVREEIDRLGAHISAARALLASDGPVGRELDFLTQEFAREANTLCAKSASADLTAAGLALKVLIDQLREQAQNVA